MHASAEHHGFMRDFKPLLRILDGPVANWLLVALPLVALLLRCYVIVHLLYPGNIEVFNTGFGGFGEYARSLRDTGDFRLCGNSPFLACQASICTNATRMPVIPLLYFGLLTLVGTPAAAVAVGKCCVLALLVAGFVRVATRDLRVSIGGVAAMYLLYLGLQPLKHGASLDYEEGMLIDLSLCLGLAVVYLIRMDLAVSSARRSYMALAAILIAVVMYFTKTTALLTLGVVLLMVLLHRASGWRLNAIALTIVILPWALWLAHTHSSAGGIRWSSSWNGENLFRGYNSGAAAIYPEISLDRAFDTDRAILEDGTVVPLGNFSRQQCFADEWAWNDYYAAKARRWVIDHPADTLRFDLKKAWVALVEVRHTPKYVSATDKTPLYSASTSAIMAAWMIYARALFFALLILVCRELRNPSKRQHLWVTLLLAGACTPYVAVFGSERHMVPILVMAGTLLVFLYLASPRDRPEPVAQLIKP
jgi:hypothetical protein